jgi:hypothetical protein
MVTVEDVEGHGGLEIVHWKTFAPKPNPVIVDVGEEGVVMVPVPLTSVHVPDPTVAVFPANVAEVLHKVWLGPAFATVGVATPVIVIVLVDAGQGALLIVH